MVTLVKTANSKEEDNAVSPWLYGAEQDKITPWNVDAGEAMHAEAKAGAVMKGDMPGATMLSNGGSKEGGILRVVTDEETETLPSKQVTRAAGEMYKTWVDSYQRNKVKPQLGSLSADGRGVAASAFFKVFEHPMNTGRVNHSDERLGSRERALICWIQS
jgi:hypothetical protein